jgi:transposase
MMTDLQMWLNPVQVDAKIRNQTVKSMAASLASGKSIAQVSTDFDMALSTVQGMLRDYIPTTAEINDFKMKFAIKKLRKNKYRGL